MMELAGDWHEIAFVYVEICRFSIGLDVYASSEAPLGKVIFCCYMVSVGLGT